MTQTHADPIPRDDGIDISAVGDPWYADTDPIYGPGTPEREPHDG